MGQTAERFQSLGRNFQTVEMMQSEIGGSARNRVLVSSALFDSHLYFWKFISKISADLLGFGEHSME